MQEAYVSYKSSPGQHVRKGHALYKYTDPTAITRCLDGATTVNQGYIYIYKYISDLGHDLLCDPGSEYLGRRKEGFQ